MHKIITAIGLSLASPSMAAEAAAPIETLPAAHLEVAQDVIDLVWPVGTFQRVMDTSMETMMDQIMDGAMNWTVGEAAALGGEEAGVEDADKSLRDVIRESDPHFEERMKLSMGVFTKEMTGILVTMEPQIRETMTRLYAKRFTSTELQDLRTFFSTPSGRRYASEAVTMMQDPDFVAASMGFQPLLLEKMPEIIKKMDAATAHLPPPPKANRGEARP